jgi:hypothetical protein
MSHRHAGFIAACLITALEAHAGTVRTLDGKLYEGDLQIDSRGKVVVTPRGGAPVEVEFSNLLQATFSTPSAVVPKHAELHGLLAFYYDNPDFSGKTILRVDPTIDFNWGQNEPFSEFSGGSFSARWIGRIEAPATGSFTFVARVDDGVRLWINHKLIIDWWKTEGVKEPKGSILLKGGQKYDIKLEYFNAGKEAEAHLLWSGPSIPHGVIPTKSLYPATPPASPGPIPLTQGLLATYYNNLDFTGHTVSRVDPQVDFDWGTVAPASGIELDTFSVRWIGQIRAPATERFTFHAVTDDGVRLWINNQLIIDQWQDQSPTESSGAFPLKTGELYNLRMEYYQRVGGACAKLLWSSPSTPKQVIPPDRFIPASGGARLASAGSRDSSRPHRGLVLRNGSFIVGFVESADGSTIRYHREQQRDLAVSMPHVALILLHPLTAAQSACIPPDRPGFLLKNGDFFEGEIRSILNGRARVSSVLFGLKDFACTDLLAVSLHKPSLIPAPYEVRMNDGSILMASGLSAGKDHLAIHDTAAGSLKVRTVDVHDIRCGASRFRSLTEMKLTDADVPKGVTLSEAFAADGLPGDLPAFLDGLPVERGIGMTTGTSLTYTLSGDYKIFCVRAGVPDVITQLARVRFIVMVDGKTVYRGSPASSADPAQEIGVPVHGAVTVTLRVENAGPSHLVPLALWVNPVLVKP